MTIDDLIRAVQDPLGDAPHLRSRERAANALLARPDESHPHVLAAVERSPTPAVVELLGRFGRTDDVPLLASLLAAELLIVRQAAARALAGHPAPEAVDALVAALYEGAEAAASASDGLLARSDRAACAHLAAAATRPEPRVRYHAAQAALHLGCLDDAAIATLRRDPDPDVRGLAEGANP